MFAHVGWSAVCTSCVSALHVGVAAYGFGDGDVASLRRFWKSGSGFRRTKGKLSRTHLKKLTFLRSKAVLFLKNMHDQVDYVHKTVVYVANTILFSSVACHNTRVTFHVLI